MPIKIFDNFDQGSQQWLDARRGILTASEIKHIITPAKLLYSSSEKERAHLYELAAQRISGYVEPHYMSDDMLRGYEDEILARQEYSEKYVPVHEVGFITNDRWGFTLGCSPDGLVGDDGMIEVKSRRQRFQIETIVNAEMPTDYMLQVQTALLVSERQWVDFISYSGGLPMATLRVLPDEKVHEAIVAAAGEFHLRLDRIVTSYHARLADPEMRLIPTERREIEEMI